MLRTVAIIRPQVSSGVALAMPAKAGLPKLEWATITPWSVAAAMSRLGRLMPMMVISFRFGRRSIRVRGRAIRSRTVHSTSKGCSAWTASASERCRSKTAISAFTVLQSALFSATLA